ncbi:hypothetical protein EST38_g686 [Candolleomyces aberdarensis]|uniref:TOG domain-containing protein n=1 Tax=Candolleomyces aberdarensis TaxID=2316362 RepID=A0A4Q2DYX2_9AGAR|nr:hypothetical protein EST38_g686 [Candolleomyces aberdarensis]
MASEESRIEKLIAQCKSNGKFKFPAVDALAKLQLEFEGGAEIPDVDAVLTLFKACLRTSNQHLTNATLYAIPPLLPLIVTRSAATLQSNPPLASSSSANGSSGFIDVSTLRQVFMTFLTSGGIIDRLGDKERAQAKARESLVLLGGYAFRAGASSNFTSKSGKNVETPMAIFERTLKESGLASKVWKVREQSILTLVHLRRANPQFPMRPYLSLLVDCLEDTDAHVRDCARTSVVELFSGPHVTDAARADLKKEMTKKNVRKTIVDGVLSKLMAAGNSSTPQSRDGSENGDAGSSKPKEYVPPSMMLQGKRPRAPSQGSNLSKSTSQPNVKEGTSSRPSSRMDIASARDLESEFAAMAKPFEGRESEHNWASRDAAIQRVRGMLKGEVHARYTDAFYACLKEGFMQWSLKTVASLRTTVAMNTCFLYSELVSALGPGLDPYCDLLLTNLLKMAGFTKKITAQQSQVCVRDILKLTTAPSRVVVPLLWTTLQEKTVQARAHAVVHAKTYIEAHGNRAKNAIEGSGAVEILEKFVKKALSDPNPAVKESSRATFWAFEAVWHEPAMAIMESLDGIARKQLERACPSAALPAGLPSTTPNVPKKSSIAAAIAASRAKAKAIATAPPSLRHQATSASQTPVLRRATSPPAARTSPKAGVPRPASPLRTSSSPGSPPSRPLASVPASRSISSNALHSSHSRSTSGASSKRARSPSLSDNQHGTRRRTSSPLASSSNNLNTLRKAMQTALPASPQSSTDQQSPTRRPGATLNPPAMAAAVRQSLLLPSLGHAEDESLLMAQTVPIPDGDTDSEDDRSMNLMSFSAAFEKFPPAKVPTPKSIGSKPTASVSNALSSGSLSSDVTFGGQQPVVVEDALRARAEQAESAAERLLELVDENDLQEPIAPMPFANPKPKPAAVAAVPPATNGNNSNGGTVRVKTKPAPIPIVSRAGVPPVTPSARATAVMRQAAMFKDSPAHGRGATSLLDVLQAQRHETGWWLKRTALFAKATPLRSQNEPEAIDELKQHIEALENGTITKESLQRIALNEDELEYALIIVWEMLENQSPYLEGREADLFSMLLTVRYCNQVNVLEATSTIRDALTSKNDPVYGLTTFHGCLKAFQAETCPDTSDADVKSATVAFGLIALGKFILRLPAEIAEEELPRLKATFISALNDRSSLVVRESAAAAIIAAQLVLQDETHLFALLDGLADDKKNLLTYLFDKHGARGATEAGSGIAKFQKEIRRLDTRTSTPLRR